ncbi:MAG: type II secretion system F family protein [Phycisphaerae bacterium]|nr:type II secretion system F family protein [Phycisphaerae bacterium]
MILIPLGLFVLLLVGAELCVALRERQRAVTRIVIGQMAMITSQNLPLGTGLMLAGQSEQGKGGLVLRRIAQLVATGLSVGEALSRAYPRCPTIVRSIVAAGEQAGRLSGSLRLLEGQLMRDERSRSQLLPVATPYVVVLVSFLLASWSGFMVVIVPKYVEIFRDFDALLPPLTVALIHATESVSFAAPIIGLWMAIVVPIAIYVYFRPRRADAPRLASQIADHLRWYAPGLRRHEFARGMEAGASLLRLFAESGMDLGRAARLIARTDMNIVLRDRIRWFADALTAGASPPEAASQAGLGDVFAAALRSAQAGASLDESLRFVTDYYGALCSRFWIVVRNLAWPLSVLMIALAVAVVLLAMFLPLVQLIDTTLGAV